MKQNSFIKSIFIFLLVLFLSSCVSTPTSTVPTANAPGVQSSPVGGAATAAATVSSSPSGLKVAFISNGNVWFWSEATPAKQLTTDGDASRLKLSSDGAVIVYQSGQSLKAVNVDGSNPRTLVDIPAFTGHPLLAQFEFRPNLHVIYFSSRDSVQAAIGTDLHMVDADNPSPQTILTQGSGKITFSPDGRLISLAQANRINVASAESSNLVSALDFTQVNTHSDWSYYPQVVWLDDATGFYTVIPASDTVADPSQKARFLYVSADGSFTAQLAEFVTADIRVSQPLIAPNGSKVVYVKSSADNKSLEIHVIDASTADKSIASFADAPQIGLPAWSPDSARFLYYLADSAALTLTGMDLPSQPFGESIAPSSLRWLDAERFLYISRTGELRVGRADNMTLSVIATDLGAGADVNSYDFAP